MVAFQYQFFRVSSFGDRAILRGWLAGVLAAELLLGHA
jgi:hypothetical protein